MAATFRSADGANPATASSAVVTKPVGVVSGDFLICVQGSDKSGSFAAMTGASGFVTVDQSTQTGAGFVKIWTLTAGGSEPSTYTFNDATGADSTVSMIAVAAGTYDPASPFAVVPTWGGSNTLTASHDAPSVTGVAGGLLVTAHMGGSGANATLTYTPPSGMTERFENSASRWIVMETNTLDLVSAGATGTKTATCSATRAYVSVSMVIAPLPTPTSLPPLLRPEQIRFRHLVGR